jgi:branched-chain amino acid transport system permease protein
LGFLLGGVYALFASGLTLVFGVMRIINIAHSVFIFMAAFITYTLHTGATISLLGYTIEIEGMGLDPILSIAITMPVMFIFGILLYRLVLARDAESPKYTEMTVLITFALALMIEGLLGDMFTGTNRTVRTSYITKAFRLNDIFLALGMPDMADAVKASEYGRILIPATRLYASMTGFALIGGLWALLRFTRLGYAIRATMQNRDAAKTVGVNVDQVSMIAFGIGIALAGASGSLYSFLFSFFPNGHWEWVALLLSLIVLGGMGEIFGAVAGALILAIAAGFVQNLWGPTWQPLTFYLSLFVILLIRPHGLFGKKIEER